MAATVRKLDPLWTQLTPQQRVIALEVRRAMRKQNGEPMPESVSGTVVGLALAAMVGGLVGLLVGIYLCRVVWP